MQKEPSPRPTTNKFRKGFKTWSEKIAVDYRIELKLRPSDPLPAIKLAEHLGVVIWTPSDFEDVCSNTQMMALTKDTAGWHALSLKIGGVPCIIHNNMNHPVRQESDIMHELAHLICDHKMERLEHETLGIPLRDFDAIQEAEAEWLGGCLQMPRVALYYKKKNGLSITQIANTFNSSEKMVRYRLGVTGLLRQ